MIGNRIAEARKKINISQAQLAERLFISPQAVGKWERGESMPDIITFNRLTEILGVDLNYFSKSIQSTAPESDDPLVEQSAESPMGDQELFADEAGEKPTWDMSRGSWVDADFSGLKNLHERFSSSNIQRCLFIGSDLSGLLLKGNHVVNCDFSESDISNGQIRGSHLGKNLFKDCSLKETNLTGSHIEGCNFSGADFTGAKLKSCDFSRNTMANAVWNRTSFSGSSLSDITFDGTMEDCSFENCSFRKVSFQNTTLRNTFFKNTILKRVKFTNCQADRITYAFLKNGKADLTGVTLLTS